MSDPQISKQSHIKGIVKKFLSKEFREKLGRRNTYLWVQRVQILEEWYHQVVEVTLFGLLSTFWLIEIFMYRAISMKIFNCTRTQKYIFLWWKINQKFKTLGLKIQWLDVWNVWNFPLKPRSGFIVCPQWCSHGASTKSPSCSVHFNTAF